MHELFRRKLEELRLTYVEIGGDRNARLASAIAAIKRLTR
jgi:hypothetical protein